MQSSPYFDLRFLATNYLFIRLLQSPLSALRARNSSTPECSTRQQKYPSVCFISHPPPIPRVRFSVRKFAILPESFLLRRPFLRGLSQIPLPYLCYYSSCSPHLRAPLGSHQSLAHHFRVVSSSWAISARFCALPRSQHASFLSASNPTTFRYSSQWFWLFFQGFARQMSCIPLGRRACTRDHIGS